MRNSFMTVWRGVTLAVVFSGWAGAQESSQSPPDEGGAAVLVELFTSEGCHSCPPADRVASEVAARADAEGTPVHVVAWHVDYWDRLGWKDPFSSEEATARQHAYARAWRERQVYTPHMVVNGRPGFVGSDAGRARSAIAEASVAAPSGRVGLKAQRTGLEVALSITSEVPEGERAAEYEVVIVAVESGLTTEVPRGENAGKTLVHAPTVRASSRAPVGAASARLTLPEGVDPERTKLIAFVQHVAGRAVVASAGLALPASSE